VPGPVSVISWFSSFVSIDCPHHCVDRGWTRLHVFLITSVQNFRMGTPFQIQE
jgi:hypothetical protein